LIKFLNKNITMNDLLVEEELFGRDRIECQIINDQQFYLSLLEEKFPFELNRIRWKKIPYHLYEKIIYEKNSNSRIEVLTFLNKVKKLTKMDENDSVVLISDGGFEEMYKIPFFIVEKCIDAIFFLPHHLYIIPTDATWCISYTFENDLYFGFSVK